jgi:hypothetical protein
MMTTKFLVPEVGGYASQLAVYLNKVNYQLVKFQGRVWYMGRKHFLLTSWNMVGKVPHKIAALLILPYPMKYTFHSF